MYLQYLIVFTQVAAGCHDGRKQRPKHVEPTWNNKLIYMVHLVGYFHSYITTLVHGFMNIMVLLLCENVKGRRLKEQQSSHCACHEVRWGNGGINPLSHDLGTRWRRTRTNSHISN
jgi:hypothetical protein